MTTIVPLDEAPEHRESYGPDRQMWVIRYTRDGQPLEMHVRRSEHTRGGIHAVCMSMATDTGAPVVYTAADIGGTYGWRLVSEGRDPLWYVVEPRGWRRARRVESCPNGCGGGSNPETVAQDILNAIGTENMGDSYDALPDLIWDHFPPYQHMDHPARVAFVQAVAKIISGEDYVYEYPIP